MDLKETAARLNEKFMGADPQEAVTWFVQHYGRKAALSSSLSYEDQGSRNSTTCWTARKRPWAFPSRYSFRITARYRKWLRSTASTCSMKA